MRTELDIREIDERLAAVLENLNGSLPSNELADMISLVRAGEPIVALENLCVQLHEYDVTVPEDVVTELKELASSMAMQHPRYL